MWRQQTDVKNSFFLRDLGSFLKDSFKKFDEFIWRRRGGEVDRCILKHVY